MHRRRGGRGRPIRAGLLCAAGCLLCAAPLRGQPLTPLQYVDGAADARALRFDGGTTSNPDFATGMPDLLSYHIGPWAPNDAQNSLFRGEWDESGDFFRLDLVFKGLVNPPGLGFPSNIFFFGDNPLLGFVEFDVDASAASGGELLGPQFRYQGAAARFGGVPQAPRFDGQVALDTCPGTFDQDVSTGPYFPERSGEEFHLAFLWGAVTAVDVGSNGDYLFEAGEKWVVRGHFFNRAHGFDDFILLCCSNGLPTYQPEVDLLFDHSLLTDRTTISFVYPLNQAGATALAGGVVEPLDCCADNQNCIVEALEIVSLSATLATATDRDNVNFALIVPWESQVAADYLDPRAWVLNAVFAGAFEDSVTFSPMLAWTDVAPNVMQHDYNADGSVDGADVALFDSFLADRDGGPCDADGVTDGAYTIFSFADGFDVHDANYDGIVNEQDRPAPFSGDADFDADNDGDVDLADYAIAQRCAVSTGAPDWSVCKQLDANADGFISSADTSAFVGVLGGPTPPARATRTEVAR